MISILIMAVFNNQPHEFLKNVIPESWSEQALTPQWPLLLMRGEVSSLGRNSVYLLPLPTRRHTGCSCSCRPSRKTHIVAHFFPESDTRHSLGGLTWIFPGPLLTLILTFSAVPNNPTVHTYFHVSFFKHEKEGSQRMVISGALGPAVKSGCLQCSSQPPPAQPPERDPNLPDGLERFSTFFFFLPQEQGDMIPNIKNTYFLSGRHIFIEKFDQNKLCWLHPQLYFPFLSNIPFT